MANEAQHTPPCDVAAEEALIGACLTNGEAYQNAAHVRPADMYRERSAWIWSAIVEQAQSGAVNPVTVARRLADAGHLEQAGGMAYLSECSERCPSVFCAADYASVIVEAAAKRRLIAYSGAIAKAAYAGEITASAAVADAQRLLNEAARSLVGPALLTPSDAAELALKRYAAIRERQSGGLPWPWPRIEHATGGIYPGELVYIGGRPRHGKTETLLQIAALAQAHGPVLVASREMATGELLDRHVSQSSGLALPAVRRGGYSDDVFDRLVQAAGEVSARKLYYLDMPRGMTTADVAREALRMQAAYGLALVVVDYVQLLDDDRGQSSEYVRVTHISRELKRLARSLGVPVVAASQIRRMVSERGSHNPEPGLADLKESGGQEQDADVVILVHRLDVDCSDNIAREKHGMGTVILAKQRQGGAFLRVPVVWSRTAGGYVETAEEGE